MDFLLFYFNLSRLQSEYVMERDEMFKYQKVFSSQLCLVKCYLEAEFNE